MGQADWDMQPKYTLWTERLSADLSLCNVSQARLNSLQQELLGVSLRIKALLEVHLPFNLKLIFC